MLPSVTVTNAKTRYSAKEASIYVIFVSCYYNKQDHINIKKIHNLYILYNKIKKQYESKIKIGYLNLKECFFKAINTSIVLNFEYNLLQTIY